MHPNSRRQLQADTQESSAASNRILVGEQRGIKQDRPTRLGSSSCHRHVEAAGTEAASGVDELALTQRQGWPRMIRPM